MTPIVHEENDNVNGLHNQVKWNIHLCHHQLSALPFGKKERKFTQKNSEQRKLNICNKLAAFLTGKLYFSLQVCDDCHWCSNRFTTSLKKADYWMWSNRSHSKIVFIFKKRKNGLDWIKWDFLLLMQWPIQCLLTFQVINHLSY